MQSKMYTLQLAHGEVCVQQNTGYREFDTAFIFKIVRWVNQRSDLKGNVGNTLSEELQAAPGALMQEAQGHIKGGPAPHLQAAGLPQHMRGGVCCLEHVVSAHPGGQQTLMRITPALVTHALPSAASALGDSIWMHEGCQMQL